MALASLAVLSTLAGAGSNTYVEGFATKQYCDQVNTTALWDTAAGELKLPPFQFVRMEAAGFKAATKILITR